MAEEQEVEPTTEQESPSVEQRQPEVDDSEAGENLEETPEEDTEGGQPEEDKNWKALREERERLAKKVEELEQKYGVQEEPKMGEARQSPAVGPLLTSQDTMTLQINEMQALNKFPELDPDSDSYDELFDIAVSGEYRAELDRYAKGLYVGQKLPLPSAQRVAKKVRDKWEKKFGSRKDEIEQKKQAAVDQKRATTEAEGRTDKRTPRGEDLENLKHRSRRGDYSAVAERLKSSGL